MVSIVSVGSLNYDLSVFVPRLPGADETMAGRSVEEFRGGKGANQIVAASRLGAEAVMVGCVGLDSRGQYLLDGLDSEGVDRRWVERVDEPTGVALITVADDGDVTIVVVSGANGRVDRTVVVAAAPAIEAADVIMLQGEIPADAARAAAETARQVGTRVVFNPAPFNDVAAQVAPLADVMVVNRAEAAQLGRVDVPMLVTTLGGDGALVDIAGREQLSVPSFPADVVDSTGAGDTFVAALSVLLAEGAEIGDAVRFGCAAGACAVEVAGAQPSLPTRQQVEERLGTSPG